MTEHSYPHHDRYEDEEKPPEYDYHPTADHEYLVAIYRKLVTFMTSVNTTFEQFAATLASIKSDLGLVSTDVGDVATNVAGLKQTILALQAQLAAGQPITQEQLNTLAGQATDADKGLQEIDAALKPLASGIPAPPPIPVVPPVPAPGPVAVPPPGTTPDTTPVISGPLARTGVVGQPFAVQLSATNGPVEWNGSALPDGLVADHLTGVISGIPTTAGTTTVTITATNPATGKSGTASLTIDILAAGATMPPNQMGAVSAASSTEPIDHRGPNAPVIRS